MGRGKKWSSEERERVAIAWTRATHDPVVGRNQSGETFDEKVYSLFSRKPPKDADPGTSLSWFCTKTVQFLPVQHDH